MVVVEIYDTTTGYSGLGTPPEAVEKFLVGLRTNVRTRVPKEIQRLLADERFIYEISQGTPLFIIKRGAIDIDGMYIRFRIEYGN